jgi:hypothetical protein
MIKSCFFYIRNQYGMVSSLLSLFCVQPGTGCIILTALSAYHGGYFNATRIGLVAKVTQKKNTLLDTIPGSFTHNLLYSLCDNVMARSFPYIVTSVPLLCHSCAIALSQDNDCVHYLGNSETEILGLMM